MNKQSLTQILEKNEYPGRGIFIGQNSDFSKSFIAYFIMGRSENSQNRIFVKTDDGIKTEAYDPAKLKDPSLVIYHPYRRFKSESGYFHVITNGAQTDTIADYLQKDKQVYDALERWSFEPDSPHFTPRISAVLYPTGAYLFSILKTFEGSDRGASRQFYFYEGKIPETGHLLHTYKNNGDPLPSYEGEPTFTDIPGTDINEITDAIWDALNKENKVSLYVCEIETITGKLLSESIKNKLNGD